MAICIIVCFLVSLLPLSSSFTLTNLKIDSHLSIGDSLISTPKGIFAAGFFKVGENAYCFSIWYTHEYDPNKTIVWMANRDQPVNGKKSKFSLQKSGNLVITDAGQFSVWTSNTMLSKSIPQLQLQDNGNLVLINTTSNIGENILWQSFDFPTNTLLPTQFLTESTNLISSGSLTNYSSGFYRLYFDNDNILRLMYKGHGITSVFWPDPWLNSWEDRSTYNNSKIAMLDNFGHFLSSDELEFNTTDYGIGKLRRLTIDVDGNLRVYSLDNTSKNWKVSWLANPEPCKIPGICGGNSLCNYSPEIGRKCTCLPGYTMKNRTDWSYGCEPVFNFSKSCNKNSSSSTSVFLQLPHVEFYGFDIGYFPNYTLEKCENWCLQYCDCKGFQHKFDDGIGYTCYAKNIMFNGYRSVGFHGSVYIRLPKDYSFEKPVQDFNLQCHKGLVTRLERNYGRKNQQALWKSFFWPTLAVGIVEIICLLAYFFTTLKNSNPSVQGYIQAATGFRKFTYSELKKASSNFSKEIGRGGGGVVYKGTLSDNRVAAIKCLKEANQGEAEFFAEVSMIGRLHHMNLIDTWGYCAEGKHRLMVYEYMEHGSLAKNLNENRLVDWKKRYEIALGTAKGLAYLHEECLEWILHCDVKPENILLNDTYQPKVADFGLSKLLTRGGMGNSSFSRIRGTRGYMAPEWVFNLPITSKVDVYSYGIVVLEMVTGRSPIGGYDRGGMEPRGLVSWVRENWHRDESKLSKIKQIVDPSMNEFDVIKLESLIEVALQCTEEDKDARPTMSQVVDMLKLDDGEK